LLPSLVVVLALFEQNESPQFARIAVKVGRENGYRIGCHGSDPTFDSDFSKICSTRKMMGSESYKKTENLFWPLCVGRLC